MVGRAEMALRPCRWLAHHKITKTSESEEEEKEKGTVIMAVQVREQRDISAVIEVERLLHLKASFLVSHSVTNAISCLLNHLTFSLRSCLALAHERLNRPLHRRSAILNWVTARTRK